MLEDGTLRRRGLKGGVRGGGREDGADNELSIETKAKLYSVIMSLILWKDKCNNDNEASLRQFKQLKQFPD